MAVQAQTTRQQAGAAARQPLAVTVFQRLAVQAVTV
jgi:hypothetical protein